MLVLVTKFICSVLLRKWGTAATRSACKFCLKYQHVEQTHKFSHTNFKLWSIIGLGRGFRNVAGNLILSCPGHELFSFLWLPKEAQKKFRDFHKQFAVSPARDFHKHFAVKNDQTQNWTGHTSDAPHTIPWSKWVFECPRNMGRHRNILLRDFHKQFAVSPPRDFHKHFAVKNDQTQNWTGAILRYSTAFLGQNKLVSVPETWAGEWVLDG